jgi:hypothetical protein
MDAYMRSETEAEEALFAFYCSSLCTYSRFEALLLLAYVTHCGRRHEAHELARAGHSANTVAERLGISPQTAARWMREPLPSVPRWARSALSELDEYQVDDVLDALGRPWRAA